MYMSELSKDTQKKLKKALEKAEKEKEKRKKKASRDRFNNKIQNDLTDEAKHSYNLYKEILDSYLFNTKKTYMRKSELARNYIDDNIKGHKKSSIKPGMMLMFNYFEPKTEAELEYYDAMPCTIFFGVVQTKEGKRVLGFNLHYYPPRLRYQILSWMFSTFKQQFMSTWDEESFSTISSFSYAYIMKKLKLNDLTFGVRMYIPGLMNQVKQIYPKYFQVAVFTEGAFRKKTREQILKYWNGKSKVL